MPLASAETQNRFNSADFFSENFKLDLTWEILAKMIRSARDAQGFTQLLDQLTSSQVSKIDFNLQFYS